MLVLIEFSPIKPDFGLLFWATLIFLLFWWLMAKFAFGPIRDALNEREHSIQNALDEAKLARLEMENLKSENEKILAQAREERSKILQEAKEMKNSIVNEAKQKAKDEANKIISNAKQEIDNQKKAAIAELKGQVGTMAIDIAEKVIRKALASNTDHQAYVNGLVKEIYLS